MFSLEMKKIPHFFFQKCILNADLACDPFKTFVIDDLPDMTKFYELFLLSSCKVAR